MAEEPNPAKNYRFIMYVVFAGLLLPYLVQDGMFLDGVTYAAISRNLAQGLGEIWKPHYTQTLYPVFYEHPPLVLIIQSWFFRLLGDSLYTERVYTLITAVFSAYGIAQIWSLLTNDSKMKSYSWLVILLWVITPVVFWSYRNNMLENSLCVFTLYAIYFILRSLTKNNNIFLIPAGFLTIAAFLSKGPVGLFPLAVPILYGMVYTGTDRRKTGWTSLLLISLSLIFIVFPILIFPELKQNILNYLNQQFIPVLKNNREITVDNRFDILWQLLLELVLPLLLWIFFILKNRLSNSKIQNGLDKPALLLCLIAISASFPFLVSLKQSRVYLVPSLPFYILAISRVMIPYIGYQLDMIPFHARKWIARITWAGALAVLVITITQIGHFSRDRKLLEDVYRIKSEIPNGSIVSTTQELSEDWLLVAYLARNGNISLDDKKDHRYFLIEQSSEPGEHLPPDYIDVKIGLSRYSLGIKDWK